MDNQQEIRKILSAMFEKLLKQHGDTPETRLEIARFTMGYMGTTYGMHIPQ